MKKPTLLLLALVVGFFISVGTVSASYFVIAANYVTENSSIYGPDQAPLANNIGMTNQNTPGDFTTYHAHMTYTLNDDPTGHFYVDEITAVGPVISTLDCVSGTVHLSSLGVAMSGGAAASTYIPFTGTQCHLNAPTGGYPIYRLRYVQDSGSGVLTMSGNSSSGYVWFESLGTINPPAGDGNTTTHIIRVNTPVMYATTTSPVAVNFDTYEASSSVPNGYSLTYVNSLTYQSKTYVGFLADAAVTGGFSGDGTYEFATTTPLSGDGTWKLTVSLLDISSEAPNAPYTVLDTYHEVWFGLNVNDNVQTVVFPGVADVQYASSSCAINFSGSFSLSDCVGYMFLPQSNTFSAYSALVPQFSQKFPFSYIVSVQSTWDSLTASSTANSPTYSYNLHDIGLGSTTPLGNFLPNVTVFSASTTEQYFPPGLFNVLKTLAGIAIILTLFLDIFFEVKHMIRT